jgi:hypothetical protein
MTPARSLGAFVLQHETLPRWGASIRREVRSVKPGVRAVR